MTDLFVWSFKYTEITKLSEAKPSRNVNKVSFSHLLPFRLILLLQFRYASVSYITQQYYNGKILITIHAFLLSSRNWTDPKISIHYIEHRLATFKQYIFRDTLGCYVSKTCIQKCAWKWYSKIRILILSKLKGVNMIILCCICNAF